VVGGLIAFVAIISALGGGGSSCGISGAPSRAAQQTIPAELMPLYTDAEARYGVPWSLLAAINSVESAFGHNTGPSSTGAVGPMQFMPATWRTYGVDGDADGRTDVMDPDDAVPAAARMLQANGAPADLHRAVFAYNPSEAYVSKVLAVAQTFAAGGQLLIAGGCAQPRTGDGSPGAVVDAANALGAMRVPYNYGGGHVTPARPGPGADGPYDGLDCSSSVSWVLQHAGIEVPTLDSTSFMSWGQPGPGRAVTLYANPTHIILGVLVNGRQRFFGTSQFGHPEAGTGPAWFTRPVSAAYLAGFVQRHPPGL
jgi:cell wall-associated NlpC family hydrolase